MTQMTHDPAKHSARLGLPFALASAVSFGMSGALARPLLDSGWTPGAVTFIRISIAAVVVAPLGLIALRGHWSLLRTNARLICLYGVLAVAGAQFAYFSAVQYMQVGPALLLEYTAPAAIVVWLWVVRGERPGRTTLIGAATCALGLVLVLDLLSGADLSLPGVLWALTAMIGCATYFLINADDTTGLPPITLAGCGLLVGAAAIGLLALVGALPFHTADAPVAYAGHTVEPWQALIALGLVTAAFAYVTGVAAGRRLGSRLASFVALSEVVAGVGWAWVLLDELPAPIQLVGGVIILIGVVLVQLGEPDTDADPALATPAGEAARPTAGL